MVEPGFNNELYLQSRQVAFCLLMHRGPRIRGHVPRPLLQEALEPVCHLGACDLSSTGASGPPVPPTCRPQLLHLLLRNLAYQSMYPHPTLHHWGFRFPHGATFCLPNCGFLLQTVIWSLLDCGLLQSGRNVPASAVSWFFWLDDASNQTGLRSAVVTTTGRSPIEYRWSAV